MEQVGYDTYCKLLDEVVKEMQGIQVKPEQDTQIDISLSSYIPENYISDSAQKIEVYQDIALCKNEHDIEEIIDEIIDRFGTMPIEVENLLEIARIKNLAKKAYVTKVVQKEDSIILNLDKNNINFTEEVVANLLKKYGNNLRFSQGVAPYITLKINEKDENKIVKIIKELLVTIGINEEVTKNQ
jgi:transcription-repair coupling factor (superfamily II helicase)